jgi:hypothetical protein
LYCILCSRNLKPTHHILKYLKENLENKLNGMVRILGKHGDFNRVEFGNALWTSVIRPCIAHGCSMWRPSSEAQRNLLQSIQYKAANIILRTKIYIPKLPNSEQSYKGKVQTHNYINRQNQSTTGKL